MLDAIAETDAERDRREPHSGDIESVHAASYRALLPLLHRLDVRLAAAIDAAEGRFAARAASDLHRGLVVTRADVAAALACVPGEPFARPIGASDACAEAPGSLSVQRLRWLQRIYALTDFDLDVVLIALAPEVDLRYERLYAYLQDDVARRRPSVDLALNLLCADAGERLRRRHHFGADAPLVRERIVHLGDEDAARPSLPGRPYRIDEQIVRLLLLDDSIDSRVARFCDLDAAVAGDARAPLDETTQRHLRDAISVPPDEPVRLYFHGAAWCGQAAAVALLAQELAVTTLTADLHELCVSAGLAARELLQTLVREAWFRGAMLHLRGFDADAMGPGQVALWRALRNTPVHCVVEGARPLPPAAERSRGWVVVPFGQPGEAQRALWWRHCLHARSIVAPASWVATLAARYRLTHAQIDDAVASTVDAGGCAARMRVAAGDADPAALRALMAAARAQGGHALAGLASKAEIRAQWDDLVLPADASRQLRELCDRFTHRRRVFEEWGCARTSSYGLGITVLFAGGSGTGKTMAAEVVAGALGLDLYRVDLARVVSKYVGETEKNLDSVFSAAADANAVLLFDEADALFGKRSEVKDAHDRYANLEISYLLQRMERYDGIAILATNLSDHLDAAFARRLTFSIHFPFPAEAARRQLWERAWPPAVPIGPEVDRGRLAGELKLAGGNIRNIALRAAFLAAADGGTVGAGHIANAARRELQKLGLGTAVAETLGASAAARIADGRR